MSDELDDRVTDPDACPACGVPGESINPSTRRWTCENTDCGVYVFHQGEKDRWQPIPQTYDRGADGRSQSYQNG